MLSDVLQIVSKLEIGIGTCDPVFAPEGPASLEIACSKEVSMPFVSMLANTPLESVLKIRFT